MSPDENTSAKQINTDETTASGPRSEKAADSPEGFIARLGRWWDRERLPASAELHPLFAARLTDVAANRLAKQWSERYRAAPAKEKREMLVQVALASSSLEPRGDQGLHFFKRLNAQSDRLQFMVELRADMLRWRNQIAGLSVLEREVESLLSNWFDVGMLELKRISWDSPASLLEKLILYEAVHEIRSWDELRHRVANNRRCYAFFHPRMSDVPLIFVEVAFAQNMANNVQVLLDPQSPSEDLSKARWAIFYSISNTQPGLRGISFGNFLLKRVIDEVLRELPKLKAFATLSPIPGFVEWLGKQDGKALHLLLHGKAAAVGHASARAGLRWVTQLQKSARLSATDVIEKTGLKLATHYLTTMKNGQLIDPVARFHLGNGARIERVNWAADLSAKGLAQSCGMMVNYLYDLDQLDANLAQLAAGKPVVGTSFFRSFKR